MAQAVRVRVSPRAPNNTWFVAAHPQGCGGTNRFFWVYSTRATLIQCCHMLQEYFPVLVFLGVAMTIGVALLALGFLIGSGSKDDEKLSPYECGFEAFDDTRAKFDVRYYLVAILFIIFDLEIAFLFPWAVSLDTVGRFGIIAMALFLGILVVGFIYEWKKGALEWD